MPTSALTQNCTRGALDQPHEPAAAAAAATLTISASCSSLGGQPQHREQQRRHRRLDHPPPAAQRRGELGAHDGLDRVGRRAGRGVAARAAVGSLGALTRDQLVARVVHDPDAVVDADPALDLDRPAGLDPGDPAPAQPDHGDHAGAVVELGLEGRHAAARAQGDGAQRAAQADPLAVGRVGDRVSQRRTRAYVLRRWCASWSVALAQRLMVAPQPALLVRHG